MATIHLDTNSTTTSLGSNQPSDIVLAICWTGSVWIRVVLADARDAQWVTSQGIGWPWQNINIVILQEGCSDRCYIGTHIILLQDRDLGMVIPERK